MAQREYDGEAILKRKGRGTRRDRARRDREQGAQSTTFHGPGGRSHNAQQRDNPISRPARKARFNRRRKGKVGGGRDGRGGRDDRHGRDDRGKRGDSNHQRNEDGNDLPPPSNFGLEGPTTIPECKGSYFCTDEIKDFVYRFLNQYYTIYDSGDRQPLLDAYHEGASLSFSTPSSSQNPSKSSLGEYRRHSRNLKRLKNPNMRHRLLKHTRLNVVAFLSELPKTHHDVASFTVDVNMYTTTLLSFTVSGVFKEVDGKSRESTKAFSRVFVAVPVGNSGLRIVNDQLSVQVATTQDFDQAAVATTTEFDKAAVATTEEIDPAAVAPAPTPPSSSVPTLSALQQEMLTAFSQQSGMNFEWSQMCLQGNQWDFYKAAQDFTDLKAEGKIPDDAFIK